MWQSEKQKTDERNFPLHETARRIEDEFAEESYEFLDDRRQLDFFLLLQSQTLSWKQSN